jgi:hypothetical protein
MRRDATYHPPHLLWSKRIGRQLARRAHCPRGCRRPLCHGDRESCRVSDRSLCKLGGKARRFPRVKQAATTKGRQKFRPRVAFMRFLIMMMHAKTFPLQCLSPTHPPYKSPAPRAVNLLSESCLQVDVYYLLRQYHLLFIKLQYFPGFKVPGRARDRAQTRFRITNHNLSYHPPHVSLVFPHGFPRASCHAP